MNRRNLFKLAGAGLALSSVPSMSNASVSSTVKVGTLPQISANNPLRLNFNENSIGSSPSAKRAIIASLDNTFRYPDAQRETLIKNIAQKYSVTDAHISLGNGSSENIQAFVQALYAKALKNNSGFQLIVPDPTFNYAELYAKALDASVIKVPLKASDLSFDIEKMQEIANQFDGISLFYLCNPNNPTSTIMDTVRLFDWIKSSSKNHFFLVDEAYAEFVPDRSYKSAMGLVKQNLTNLIVTRTFSKLYGLAGLRVGYAVAHPDVIAMSEAFMSLDNTNLSGAVAATAAIKDEAYQQHCFTTINHSRQIIEDVLKELNLNYLPSNGNFIFHQILGDVKTYEQRMKSAHVLVGRPFPPLDSWNRLTIGTPEEMTVFARILRDFRSKGWV